jgi:hypothetical protein
MSMAPTTGSRGLISMSVRTRNPEIIAEIENGIRDKSHQVSSQRISQSQATGEFACQFETSVVVTPRAVVDQVPQPDRGARRR